MTELSKNAFDVFSAFAQSQETFEEAKKKNTEESSKRVNYLRFDKDGTYNVRILPLAPVIDSEGVILPMDRKGYEYPLRSLMLKIVDTSKPSDKKPKITYVNVCNAKQAFPQLKDDLIDTYLATACDIHGDDEALCKKLRGGSFDGGLRWDSKRCMYVIDCDKRDDGIQILQLSFAQYKELEERKLSLWTKLNKKQNVNCPISSIDSAYPLEITRKNDNGKTSYSFNIDTVSGIDELGEDELNALLNAQRLPNVLYRYTRFHLEATIAYLKQLDDKFDIAIMDTEEVKDCIEQIKMVLPADDQSHFTFGKSSSNNGENEESELDGLDALWARFDKIEDANLGDDSEEGQELRSSIIEFVKTNNLPVKVVRSKTNQDLLDECEKYLTSEEEESNEDDKEPTQSARKPAKGVEEEEEEEQKNEKTDGDNEEEEEEFSSRRTQRNDDTNEPAVRSARRAARPLRRR